MTVYLPKKKICFKFYIERFIEVIKKKTLNESFKTRWIEIFHAVNGYIELTRN